MIVLLIIFLVLLIIAIVLGIQGLIYWGIGSFICWAFSIPFAFTFWHGLAIAFIVSMLGSIFKDNDISVKLKDLDID